MRIFTPIWLKIVFIAGFLFAGSLFNAARAQQIDYKAYSLFVYNFMKYTEWSGDAAKGDFIIGVLGDSPIMKELNTLASSKKLKGRNIVVKKFATADECTGCHLLYVASSKSSMMKSLKESLKTKPVLIVGEREGLANKGAGISFVTLEDDTLKFDINKKEIEQHGLKVASQLIQLGIPVD
ncbi:MAG: YfiR family protein [Flavobacteriales bacterium]